jgi:hypothetical protein
VNKVALFGIACVLVVSQGLYGAVVWSDDFESYASQAQMEFNWLASGNGSDSWSSAVSSSPTHSIALVPGTRSGSFRPMETMVGSVQMRFYDPGVEVASAWAFIGNGVDQTARSIGVGVDERFAPFNHYIFILNDDYPVETGSRDTGIVRTQGWHDVLLTIGEGAPNYGSAYLDGVLLGHGNQFFSQIASPHVGFVNRIGRGALFALDDITVYDTIIPEPMTISLLGLGGLALLRRKHS